uniref:Transmembrane protein n=1 Tax=Salix viminalis TaxID=40686 RepID=A0A6N2LAA7_SALVM
MASQQKREEEDQPTTSPPAAGFGGMVVERYRKIREHAETYPYVWASYIVVYGGLGLWATYRWRKLRKTEDRVRALQERLRKLVETQEGSSSAKSVEKAPPSSTDKTTR